jgi:hypothetical protein
MNIHKKEIKEIVKEKYSRIAQQFKDKIIGIFSITVTAVKI